MRKRANEICEALPFGIMMYAGFAYIASYFDFYSEVYPLLSENLDINFLALFVLWAYSGKWSVISKKSLRSLFLLNALNFVNNFVCLQNYYDLFMVVILFHFATITMYIFAKTQQVKHT